MITRVLAGGRAIRQTSGAGEGGAVVDVQRHRLIEMVRDVPEYRGPALPSLAEASHRAVIPMSAAVEILVYHDIRVGSIESVRIGQELPVSDVTPCGARRIARNYLEIEARQVPQRLDIVQAAISGDRRAEYVHRRHNPRARVTSGASRLNRAAIAAIHDAEPSRRILAAGIAHHERILSGLRMGGTAAINRLVECWVEVLHELSHRHRGIRRPVRHLSLRGGLKVSGVADAHGVALVVRAVGHQVPIQWAESAAPGDRHGSENPDLAGGGHDPVGGIGHLAVARKRANKAKRSAGGTDQVVGAHANEPAVAEEHAAIAVLPVGFGIE